ncbi:MAG: hypothetical protein ACFFEA_05895 [Candidatus Thorarchaeota archaeon]
MKHLAELMKGYWVDKKANPLHRIHKIIEKGWQKTKDDVAVSEQLMLVRDGVFGALDMLSLSLPLNESTEQIVQQLVKTNDWNEGRRAVRSECAKIASRLISQGDISHLHLSALQRDGFGFLVPDLEDALLEDLRKAEPQIRKGRVNLTRLANSVLGRRLLREHMITDDKLDENDSRFLPLKEAYERLLVEMELEGHEIFPQDTLQTTLNGRIVEKSLEFPVKSGRDSKQIGIQSELAEFIADKKKPTMKKTKKTKKGEKAKKRKTGGKA